MKSFSFQLPDTSIVLEEAMKEIREEINSRQGLGVYDHVDASRVLSLELQNVQDSPDALEQYLKAIRRSWAVDINEFEIPSKGSILSQQLVIIKKIIWKCLKFYTYRIFSQQREYNSQLGNTMIAIHRDYGKKIRNLETRIQKIKSLQ
jgi:hypothetical protein